MKKYNKCPKCDSYQLGERWCKGRKLQQYCYNDNVNDENVECGWEGEPRTPEQKAIGVTHRVFINSFSGWNYIIYDKFGHPMISSRYFESEKNAIDKLNDDLKKGLKDKSAGPYTGVLFYTPSSILIEGRVFNNIDS
jgi:pectin methylesterase-like acyl-CoA thioesterase